MRATRHPPLNLASQCGGGDACINCSSTGACTQCARGWFLDPGGAACKPCPDGCLTCESAANCTSCLPGMGAVGGRCLNCTQPHCLYCDGDAGRCTACGTEEGERSMQEPGPAFYPDPTSGACLPVRLPAWR